MAENKHTNLFSFYSVLIFVGSTILWGAAVWLGLKYSATPDALNQTVLMTNLVSLLPYSVGAYLGFRGLYQKQGNQFLGFVGFTLNGIMVFRAVYAGALWVM